MLIAYSFGDAGLIDPNQPKKFIDETIYEYVRTRDVPMFYTRYKAAINSFEDFAQTGVYHHHVSYSSIMDKLIWEMNSCSKQGFNNPTRLEILDYILGVVSSLQGYDTSQFEMKLVHELGVYDGTVPPTSHRLAFDTYLNWACEFISYWPPNMWQGTSQGDGGGTKVDYPKADAEGATQVTERLDEAAKVLSRAIETQHLRTATMPNDQVIDDEGEETI